MKIFKDNTEYSRRVNFVDSQNVLVGFDYESHCCESFGWFLSREKPNEITGAVPFLARVDSADIANLEDYVFSTDETLKMTARDEGDFGDYKNMVVFELVPAKTKDGWYSPDLYLVLYNHHNGYYSHGFTVDVGGKRALEDSI